MTPDLELVDLGPGDDLLDRLYREVLEPSFAPAELEELDDMREALAEPARSVVVALAGGEVVGGAVGDWDPESRVALLSYLAVKPGLRGRGIGGRLMRHVAAWWERPDALAGLAEVDDPRHHSPGEYGDPVARLRFYERVGAEVLDLPYTQPEVRAGEGRVAGMLLLAFTVAPDALAPGPARALRPDVLATFLRGYYEDAEGAGVLVSDEEVVRLFGHLAAVDGIALLPLDRVDEVERTFG